MFKIALMFAIVGTIATLSLLNAKHTDSDRPTKSIIPMVSPKLEATEIVDYSFEYPVLQGGAATGDGSAG